METQTLFHAILDKKQKSLEGQGIVTIPPAALLNHVVELVTKVNLKLTPQHIAHLLVAAVKLFAGTVSPLQTALDEKIQMDALSSLSEKLAPATDPDKREKQRRKARAVLHKLLWGRLKGAAKAFTDAAFNVYVFSVRRQSSRYLKDFLEGGLVSDWRQSLVDLVAFLRLQRADLVHATINSINLADEIEKLLFGQLGGVLEEAENIDDNADVDMDDDDDEDDGEGKKKAEKRRVNHVSRIPPVRFSKPPKRRHYQPPPPSPSKSSKEPSNVFSRFMRLVGLIRGDEEERTAVRAAIMAHVDAMSREVMVAGQVINYKLLLWFHNKETERAPVITKKRSNLASQELFRHALSEGRSFARGRFAKNAAPPHLTTSALRECLEQIMFLVTIE
jgi:hypothetical protein